MIDNDGTGDIYPHYPEDGEFDFHNIDAICSIAQAIKVAGNIFYKREDYVRANLKYKKALRYLNKLHEQDISPEVEQRLLTLEMPCLLNWLVFVFVYILPSSLTSVVSVLLQI